MVHGKALIGTAVKTLMARLPKYWSVDDMKAGPKKVTAFGAQFGTASRKTPCDFDCDNDFVGIAPVSVR